MYIMIVSKTNCVDVYDVRVFDSEKTTSAYHRGLETLAEVLARIDLFSEEIDDETDMIIKLSYDRHLS